MHKMYPKHKKENKSILRKIDDENDADPMKKLVYDYVFKYVPIDPLMMVLVLKAAKFT